MKCKHPLPWRVVEKSILETLWRRIETRVFVKWMLVDANDLLVSNYSVVDSFKEGDPIVRHPEAEELYRLAELANKWLGDEA